ncbi:MAG: hypothetical protein AUK01_02915 [Anaerolineae bacterium CG2_30_57_67]|nr:MAG: hypothetical protein AUK01_02915 [Anaerolineae bacterium CG2_30_57_67]
MSYSFLLSALAGAAGAGAEESAEEDAGADSDFSTLAGRLAPEGERLSVAYQPEPLKTTPTGV